MEEEKFKYKMEIHIEMFRYNLLIVIGEIEDAPLVFRKYLKKRKESKIKEKGLSLNFAKLYKGKLYTLVFINSDYPKVEIYSTLFHELDHQRWLIIENLGIEDKETSAYITGYFARCVRPLVAELLK